MEQSEGTVVDNNKVCLLNSALYGSKRLISLTFVGNYVDDFKVIAPTLDEVDNIKTI